MKSRKGSLSSALAAIKSICEHQMALHTTTTTTMTRDNGSRADPVKVQIFEGVDFRTWATLDGGVFNGSELSIIDIGNLIEMLDDVRTSMREAAASNA